MNLSRVQHKKRNKKARNTAEWIHRLMSWHLKRHMFSDLAMLLGQPLQRVDSVSTAVQCAHTMILAPPRGSAYANASRFFLNSQVLGNTHAPNQTRIIISLSHTLIKQEHWHRFR